MTFSVADFDGRSDLAIMHNLALVHAARGIAFMRRDADDHRFLVERAVESERELARRLIATKGELGPWQVRPGVPVTNIGAWKTRLRGCITQSKPALGDEADIAVVGSFIGMQAVHCMADMNIEQIPFPHEVTTPRARTLLAFGIVNELSLRNEVVRLQALKSARAFGEVAAVRNDCDNYLSQRSEHDWRQWAEYFVLGIREHHTMVEHMDRARGLMALALGERGIPDDAHRVAPEVIAAYVGEAGAVLNRADTLDGRRSQALYVGHDIDQRIAVVRGGAVQEALHGTGTPFEVLAAAGRNAIGDGQSL